MGDWQRIDTAPKDGTRILLSNGKQFAAGERMFRIEPASKLRGYNANGELDPNTFLEQVPNPDAGKRVEWWQLFGCSAFTADTETSDYDGPLWFEPTYWMPLFDPPTWTS